MLRDPLACWYGLELSGETGVKSGTMYPALARLEGSGWVSSAWEDIDPAKEGRPRRRLYQLTGYGETAAREKLEALAAEIEQARAAYEGWRVEPGGQPA